MRIAVVGSGYVGLVRELALRTWVIKSRWSTMTRRN